MDPAAEPWHLTVELAVTLLAVLVMTITHSLGLIGILRIPIFKPENMEERELDGRAVLLLGGLGLCLFALHLIEIVAFALFYWFVDAAHRLEGALYLSASSYATLGAPDAYFPREWRIVVAVEALIGFVLITWSAAFIINAMRRLYQH